jgi:hypothetical protein
MADAVATTDKFMPVFEVDLMDRAEDLVEVARWLRRRGVGEETMLLGLRLAMRDSQGDQDGRYNELHYNFTASALCDAQVLGKLQEVG